MNSPRGANETRMEHKAVMQALTADKASLAAVRTVDYALVEKERYKGPHEDEQAARMAVISRGRRYYLLHPEPRLSGIALSYTATYK